MNYMSPGDVLADAFLSDLLYALQASADVASCWIEHWPNGEVRLGFETGRGSHGSMLLMHAFREYGVFNRRMY